MCRYEESKLFKEMGDLLHGEHRSILADIFLTNIAAGAFAHTAFHLAFKGSDYLIVSKTQFLEFNQSKVDHDRRSADNGDGVFR